MLKNFDANSALLVVIDMQERLLPAMSDAARCEQKVNLLLRGATALDLPVIATEQYPKGLGKTVGSVAENLPALAPVVEKSCFSCFGADEFSDLVDASQARTLIICGIESHVCVMQTALDALEKGFQVVLPCDAIASRDPENVRQTLDQLRHEGVFVVSSEAILFQLLGGAQHPAFKSVSKLIKEA